MKLTTDTDFLADLRTIAFGAAKRHIRDERATLGCPVELFGTAVIVTLRTSLGERVRVHLTYGGDAATLESEDDTQDLGAAVAEVRRAS